MMHKIAVLAVLVFLTGCGSQPSAESNTPTPDEKAAIAALGQINQAQKDYFRRTRRYALEYDELISEHLLAAGPAAPGYEIQMKPSADAIHYTITAAPTHASQTARNLFTDESGVIRAEQGKMATAQSSPI